MTSTSPVRESKWTMDGSRTPLNVVVFTMLTLHGTLDNVSERGRVRLTCDVRFQPECEGRDPRYFGSDPSGTTGAGWGELNGAKPLDEPWHIR